VLYLALSFWTMARAPIERIRQRACVEDEGAIALLVLTTASALASLAAVVSELGHAPSAYRVSLGATTILLSWAFMHVMFALHYAHEFYGEGIDDRAGGLVFPGNEEPDYWDFLYYSLVVAMSRAGVRRSNYQQDDPPADDRARRRLVLLQRHRAGADR